MSDTAIFIRRDELKKIVKDKDDRYHMGGATLQVASKEWMRDWNKGTGSDFKYIEVEVKEVSPQLEHIKEAEQTICREVQ